LGPLHALLEDASIIELVVEGTRAILVDRGGGFAPAPQRFSSAAQVRRAAEHLLAQGGVSATRAIEDAVLADGGHVTVIFPPVAVGGPIIEVRRTSRASVSGEGLVGQGMLSNDMLTMLRAAITLRRNVLVMGAEDAGVPTLISTLAQSTDERLAVVESTPELSLGSSKAMRFCAGTTSLGTLIQTASRLRAERLVVDGIRGPEARDALLAMAARGGGTLVGVRAAAHAGVLEHLEALASLGSSKEGVAALIGASVHVIVRMARGADGVRRVESISELGTEGTVDLFEHGENGFASTGYRPSFMQG
jgi:pilus assembly protein CpaF